MAKRNSALTEKKIAKWEKEGRGIGEGKDYKPWLTIQSFPSLGLSSRSVGWKTNRLHHCLSKQEYDYFCLLEWDNSVVDIREQYPLTRMDTLDISEKIGIKHPIAPGSRTPIVMTTDFLVSVVLPEAPTEKRLFARTIKNSKELENPRVLQKLEIERVYWEQREIDWCIVTEKELPTILITNIQSIHEAYFLPRDIEERTFYGYLEEMSPFLNLIDIPIVQLMDSFDRKIGAEPGTGLNLFQYLIAKKEIEVNMSRLLNTRSTLREITTF